MLSALAIDCRILPFCHMSGHIFSLAYRARPMDCYQHEGGQAVIPQLSQSVARCNLMIMSVSLFAGSAAAAAAGLCNHSTVQLLAILHTEGSGLPRGRPGPGL